MKNPLPKSIAYASIPSLITIALVILYKILRVLGWKEGSVIAFIVIAFIVIAFGLSIFFITYDKDDMKRYKSLKKYRKEEDDRKRQNFEKEFEKMKQGYAAMEKRVNERLNRWDDF